MRSVPALGGRSARRQRLQRHRHAARAARGGPPEEEAARGLRLVVVGVRRPARPAQARGPADGAHLALRGHQGGRRAVRLGVEPPLRRRDGGPALLQRVRPAPGPQERVRGGDPALHPVGAGRASRSRSTATAPSRATSPTSTTWSRPTCSPRARRGAAPSGQGLQRGLRQPHEPARDHRASSSGCSDGRFERKHSPTRVGDVPAHPGRRERGQARLGYEPLVDFDEGLRRTVEFFTGRKLG